MRTRPTPLVHLDGSSAGAGTYPECTALELQEGLNGGAAAFQPFPPAFCALVEPRRDRGTRPIQETYRLGFSDTDKVADSRVSAALKKESDDQVAGE